MRKLLYIMLLLSITISAQTILPKGFSNKEKQYILENYGQRGDSWEMAWQRYLHARKESFSEYRAPSNIIISPAEYEQADGVCFAWKGYSTLMKKLIKEVSLDAKAFVAVSYNANSVKSELENYGCNMENIEILQTRLNSVWMRDYGPHFIYTTDGKKEIIDLNYNRPRPDDDKFPSQLAKQYGWKSHLCKLILPGGNLILDGHGVAIMTDVTFDPAQGGDPNLTVKQLEEYMKKYFNCHTIYIVKDMQNDGTGHIDMFCKLLDDRNIIVGEYENPSDGYGDNYYILNEVAKQIATLKNGKGEHFIVHRIPMPKYSYGTSYSHTNALIINKKVLVPIYGKPTDERALAVYRKILPGYKVCGFDCNRIIGANGAIHCITKLVMSDPLKLEHKVPQNVRSTYISIDVKVQSLKALKKYGVNLFWSVGKKEPLRKVSMGSLNQKDFSAIIPSKKSRNIYYYIQIEDVTGRVVTSPSNAPTNLHIIQNK